MTGQKTGSEAHMVARETSIEERTIGVGPYQVGSKVGRVVARVSTMLWRRQMDIIFTLLWVRHQ